MRVTCDGATLTTAVLPLNRYMVTPAPKALGIEAFREGPIGAMIFGGPAGAPMFVLLNLLTGVDAVAGIGQLGGTLQLPPAPLADVKTAGASAKSSAIIIEFANRKTQFLLEVDPATKLITSIDIAVDLEQLTRGAPDGQEITVEQFGWKSARLRPNFRRSIASYM